MSESPKRPGVRERGRMRRRLREQQRLREALLLDLGALVFELHRHGRREPDLLQAKAAELAAVDQEVRGLAEALDTDQGHMQLVAAGIVGSCASCGSILSTDARYCSSCGAPAEPAATAQELPGETPAGFGPVEGEWAPDESETGDFAAEEERSHEAGSGPEELAWEDGEPYAEEEVWEEDEPEPLGEPTSAPEPPENGADAARRALRSGLRRGRDLLGRLRS